MTGAKQSSPSFRRSRYWLRAGRSVDFGTLDEVHAGFLEVRRRIAELKAARPDGVAGATDAANPDDVDDSRPRRQIRWATDAEVDAEFAETKRRVLKAERRRR